MLRTGPAVCRGGPERASVGRSSHFPADWCCNSRMRQCWPVPPSPQANRSSLRRCFISVWAPCVVRAPEELWRVDAAPRRPGPDASEGMRRPDLWIAIPRRFGGNRRRTWCGRTSRGAIHRWPALEIGRYDGDRGPSRRALQTAPLQTSRSEIAFQPENDTIWIDMAPAPAERWGTTGSNRPFLSWSVGLKSVRVPLRSHKNKKSGGPAETRSPARQKYRAAPAMAQIFFFTFPDHRKKKLTHRDQAKFRARPPHHKICTSRNFQNLVP